MSVNAEAGSSLLFYTGTNYAGTSQSVAHGVTGTLATGNDSWTYKSVAMSAMHAFCWSEVNTADASRNYQNHTESLITASIADLTALYSATAFPLSYLGIDPAVATPVWLDMSAVTGDVNAVAATSVVGGSTTSITTLSRPGLEGVAGFVGLTAGSSVVAGCSYGTYNVATGQVAWSGVNAGTLVLEYTGAGVTILSATGFPEGWTFDVPAMQADGSWKITVEGGAASGSVISSLTSDQSSIANDGTDAAFLTATVTDAGGKPVSGVTVNWSTAPGSLSAATSVTNASGQATVTLTDTGDTGACVVTASLDNGSTKSVSVALTDGSGGDVTLVSVTSDKDSIVNDGEDQAYLTATVQDAAGQPAEGVTVGWTTDLGTLNHKQQDTDETGQSHVKLSDLGDTGTAVVTATLPDGSDMYVKITVNAAVSGLTISSLTSDKDHIANDGVDAAVLTATVTDGTGAAAEGVTVNWSTTLGELSAATSITNGAGQATVSLTDSGDSGTITVTAALDNGSSQSVTLETLNFVSGYEGFESQEPGTIVEVDSPVCFPLSGLTLTCLSNYTANQCAFGNEYDDTTRISYLSFLAKTLFTIGGAATWLVWNWGYFSGQTGTMVFYNDKNEKIGVINNEITGKMNETRIFKAPPGTTFSYFTMKTTNPSGFPAYYAYLNYLMWGGGELPAEYNNL